MSIFFLFLYFPHDLSLSPHSSFFSLLSKFYILFLPVYFVEEENMWPPFTAENKGSLSGTIWKDSLNILNSLANLFVKPEKYLKK
jgi:hypothetical protein